MGTIARGTKSATGTVNFGASTPAKSSEVNTDLNTIVTAINGNIDNDNVKAGAGIVATKLNLGTVAQNVEFTGGFIVKGIELTAGTLIVDVDETKFSHKLPIVIGETTYYLMVTAT